MPHLDPSFEGNRWFQGATDNNKNSMSDSEAPTAAAGAGMCAASVPVYAQSGAAAGAGGRMPGNHYPSAADLNGDMSAGARARIASLEADNRLLKAQVETYRKTASAWGHHRCDGCKGATGSVRFRCMTCADMDYCMTCVVKNNKFCGHTMQVIRGGLALPSQGAGHGPYGCGIGVVGGGAYGGGHGGGMRGYGYGDGYAQSGSAGGIPM